MTRRVILLGKGSLAIRIAGWFVESDDYSLDLVVSVIPEPEWTESLSDWARTAGIPTVASGDYRDISHLSSPGWRGDLLFSVFYDRIFSASFLTRCETVLNLHNSPLPRYRGVSPINWALKNGEVEHGVTIHQVTPGIDDGPIVSQVRFSIYPAIDEVIDVYERALGFGWELFRQTMPMLDCIQPRPQVDADALYYDSSENELLGERRYFTRAESIATAGQRQAARP